MVKITLLRVIGYVYTAKRRMIMGHELTISQINTKEKEARQLVHKKSLYSSAAAILPIPFLDIGTDMKLMRDMSSNIEEIFGLEHEEVNSTADDQKERLLVMGTSFLSEFIGNRMIRFMGKRIVKRGFIFRLIPFFGKIISGVISYYMMKRLGNVHVNRCVRIAKGEI